MEITPSSGFRIPWRVTIGVLVIAYGALLTAGNAGWFPAYRILDHWFAGVTLVAFGVTKLSQCQTSSGRAVGWGAILVGLLWLALEVGGTRVRIEQWWPLVIVAIGVLLIMRAADFRSPSVFGGAPAGSSQASGIAFWSGINRRVTSSAFAKADFAAVMGGIEVDLRNATTAGGTAVIEVFVLMGGIEITVPPDWIVQNEALTIMGGVEDKSSGSKGAQNTLILRGLILMGGVEIKT